MITRGKSHTQAIARSFSRMDYGTVFFTELPTQTFI